MIQILAQLQQSEKELFFKLCSPFKFVHLDLEQSDKAARLYARSLYQHNDAIKTMGVPEQHLYEVYRERALFSSKHGLSLGLIDPVTFQIASFSFYYDLMHKLQRNITSPHQFQSYREYGHASRQLDQKYFIMLKDKIKFGHSVFGLAGCNPKYVKTGLMARKYVLDFIFLRKKGYKFFYGSSINPRMTSLMKFFGGTIQHTAQYQSEMLRKYKVQATKIQLQKFDYRSYKTLNVKQSRFNPKL